ncbi:MAG: type I polyketide synthase, partial [Desulfamplus sp.]|nr:type I polyketide synthase [Desulfamplus sp.]
YCAIGSVKANIGHLDTAAGVASLIKTVLSLKNEAIPPMPGFSTPNPKLELEKGPFFVNSKLLPWSRIEGKPRRAGISSFGQGGTNAHIIVEEAPKRQDVKEAQERQSADNYLTSKPFAPETLTSDPLAHNSKWQLIPLSARTPESLKNTTIRLTEFIKKTSADIALDITLEDVAFTLQTGRRNFAERRAVLVDSPKNLVSILSDLSAGRSKSAQLSKQTFSGTAPSRPAPVVFMFPGQDMQHDDMARGLYSTEPVFRAEVDKCAQILRKNHFPNLPSDWIPSASDQPVITANRACDPVPIFVVEYALARMWQSFGVQPQAMLGYSLGEYTAACISGVLSLEDALAMAVAGGRLLSTLKPGIMLGVSMTEKELLPLLGSELDIAMISTPNQCVVGGSYEAVSKLEAALAKQGTGYTRLPLTFAFHTRLMEPFLEPFRTELKKVRFNPPVIPYLSCVTGRWINAEEAMNPEHYVNLARYCVRLSDGFNQLIESHDKAIWIEVGPGQGLASLAMQQPG